MRVANLQAEPRYRLPLVGLRCVGAHCVAVMRWLVLQAAQCGVHDVVHLEPTALGHA